MLAVAFSIALGWAREICRTHRARRLVAYLVFAVGLVGQVVLLLTTAYLVDLCISLTELWAELARKHLEITLS